MSLSLLFLVLQTTDLFHVKSISLSREIIAQVLRFQRIRMLENPRETKNVNIDEGKFFFVKLLDVNRGLQIP